MKQMEKQTIRKIKVLHSDHDGSARISSYDSVRTRASEFTSQKKKSEVAKEMNCFVLQKVWNVLSTAGLDKSYWAEALAYGSQLLNRLPSTAIGGKTLLEIWLGGAARDHGSLRVIGCQPMLM